MSPAGRGIMVTDPSTSSGQGLVGRIRAGIERVGWSETARRSGVDRVKLHRTFGERMGHGNPRLELLLAVLPHVGLSLSVTERRP